MDISFIRLKPVIRELRSIREELSRIADCMEMELSDKGIHMRPPKADTSGPEPSISYVDEEMDYIRETVERYKREDEEKMKNES